ncbi:MAG: hypothetical protein AAF805_00275 [Planctomycetota bacterium]
MIDALRQADPATAIAGLEAALASGVRSVDVEGTRHTFGSVQELRDAIAYFRERQAGAARRPRKVINKVRLY